MGVAKIDYLEAAELMSRLCYLNCMHIVEQYPYHIETQKKVIDQLLSINKRLDFKVLLSNSENKVHFVYNFLAMLEMLQQDLISIQTGLGYNNFWIEAKISSINS